MPSPKLTLFAARAVRGVDRGDHAVRRPSTIADGNRSAAYRTSETGDLAADLPAVREIEWR